jgi:outer membrane protein OmpA-like peptidoglycan-associated protein
MKNRLYSFEEFLNEAYQIISEAAVSWDQGVSPFVSLLSGGADAAKPLARLKSMITSVGPSLRPSSFESDLAASMEKLVARFNSKGGAKVKSIELTLGQTEYNNLIGGKATYKGVPPGLAGGVEVKPTPSDINKLLLAVSGANIRTKSAWGGIRKQDDKRIWMVIGVDSDDRDTDIESVKDLNDIDGTALIDGSGILKQRIMTASGTTLAFEVSPRTGPLAGVIDIPGSDYQTCLVSGKNAAKKDAKFQPEATFTLVIYILKEINPNAGTEMPYESLKIEKIPVETGGDTFPLAIQDNGVLFEKGSAKLKEDGKKYMANAIANKFSSVEKIEVIGGASQEGKEDFNKQLCIDRAKNVADFLTKDLGYTATASTSTAQIQPKESTEDRETWRKVTLKITGKSRATVTTGTEDKVYYAESTYKLDQAVIVQATYNITVDGNFK